jgi:hypothetical protein
MSNQRFGNARPDYKLCAFDALPARLRRIIANAPYDYTSVSVLKMWRETRDVDYCARRIIERIFEQRDEAIRRDWGPDHPMIGARPKGWQ